MPLSRRLLAVGTVGLVGLVFLVHRPPNFFLHDQHEHQQRGLRGVGPERRLQEVLLPKPAPVKAQDSDMKQVVPAAEIDFVKSEAEHMDRQISGMLPGGGRSPPV